MTFSRRDWLRLTGAASGSAIFTLACAGRTTRTHVAAIEASDDEIATWLQEAVAEISVRWPDAHGLARRHTHAAAALDVQGANAAVQHHAGVVLGVRDASGKTVEVRSSRLDREGILALAQVLRDTATRRGVRDRPSASAGASASASPRQRAGLSSAEPQRWAPTTMREQVAALAARADRLGTSRIIYRGAGLDLDATTTWHAGPMAAYRLHQVRRRSAVVLVAASGQVPVGHEVAMGSTLEPGAAGAADLDDAALAGAIDSLLRLTTPQALPAGPAEVLLDAATVSRLFEAVSEALSELLPDELVGAPGGAPTAWPWSVADRGETAASWSLLSAPSAVGAYGGYSRDDLGAPATERVLLRDGVPAPGDASAPWWSPPAGHFARQGLFGAALARPRHLELLAPEARATAELIGGIEAGFSLENGTAAQVDLRRDRVILHARVAREIRRGTTTGRAFADIELRAKLSELLTNIAGFSQERQALARRQEANELPDFFSSRMPALLSRAVLATRSRA